MILALAGQFKKNFRCTYEMFVSLAWKEIVFGSKHFFLFISFFLSLNSDHLLLGEKAMIYLAQRLPTGEEEMPRLVQDPTVASLLCTIYQLANKNDKNAK